MSAIDIVVFVAFVAVVIGVGLYKSKGEATHGEHGAANYFLAGRGLSWWLIGFSLIAANISTEQFVGMSGQAANWLGIAIASYEWMAAVTLVVVAFVFLPTFLRSGIYTMPEFLEYRFNPFARTIMAVSTMIILVGVPTASVIYSGAKVISVYFAGLTLVGLDLGNIAVGCWIIGILSAVYVFAGGLKACAWADLLQGSALIAGGAVVMVLALRALGAADPAALAQTAVTPGLDPAQLASAGAWERIQLLNGGALPAGKLHMVRPASDPSIPWTALVVGLWIPNFFYWGLNQYITQRTLGSKSLAEGQKGIVFAALLKLVIPFIVVIPGILAFNLFNSHLKDDAVNRNAEILAEKSPDLYRSLSASMKPVAVAVD
jgi:SSS family solute:Na+ symporter